MKPLIAFSAVKGGDVAHDHVPDDDLEVLDDLHVVEGEVDDMVSLVQRLAAIEPKDGDGSDSLRFRLVEHGKDVGRVPAPGEHDQQIARLSEHAELLREDDLVGQVISDATQHTDIGSFGFDAEQRLKTCRSAELKC